MSQPKFAAITSGLLSRKGEAGPSASRQSFDERWQKVSPAPPVQVSMPTAPAPAPLVSAPLAEASVKIALRLSEGQHFRMRVAAAQLQVTRQVLMSAALDHYLSTVCAAGVPQCRCLSRDAKEAGASKSTDCKGC